MPLLVGQPLLVGAVLALMLGLVVVAAVCGTWGGPSQAISSRGLPGLLRIGRDQANRMQVVGAGFIVIIINPPKELAIGAAMAPWCLLAVYA